MEELETMSIQWSTYSTTDIVPKNMHNISLSMYCTVIGINLPILHIFQYLCKIKNSIPYSLPYDAGPLHGRIGIIQIPINFTLLILTL